MLVKDLVKRVSVWKASVNDVKELPTQVSFHVGVPWGLLP